MSHSWTTTSSVAGSTSATRAWPVSRSSIASSTTDARVECPSGTSSPPALPQLLDAAPADQPWLTLPPTNGEALCHQRQPLHGLDDAPPARGRRRPRRRGRPGSTSRPPSARQRLGHRPGVGPAVARARGPRGRSRPRGAAPGIRRPPGPRPGTRDARGSEPAGPRRARRRRARPPRPPGPGPAP